MFWKRQFSAKSSQERNKTVLQKLYQQRKFPDAKIPDTSGLDAGEREEFNRWVFLQQYLNIWLGGLWCVEQEDTIYGSLNTYDMPDTALCYQVWHGEYRVARIEVKFGSNNIEDHDYCDIVASLDWAGCFDAQDVRWFFQAVASVHIDIFNFDGEVKLVADDVISSAMNDAVWNAFSHQKQSELDGLPRDFEIEPIELCFTGDFKGYDKAVDRWKSRGLDIFQLEKDRIKNSNDRL